MFSRNETLDGEEISSASSAAQISNHMASGETKETVRYKVLSYNICWGCMEADAKDTTGMVHDLGRQCMKKAGKTTVCAKNMGDAIQQYNKLASGYDFMSFQEASKFEDLGLQTKIRGMVAVTHGARVTNSRFELTETKYNYLVTAYNKAAVGAHDEALKGVQRDCVDSRPYLILIFDRAKVIHMNMHNCQPGFPVRNPSWRGFPNEFQERLKDSFKEKPERKKYRVILTGDFNDLKGILARGVTIPWLQQKLRIRDPLAAKSCCTSYLRKGGKHVGDYIFDSASPGGTVLRVVPSYDRSKPQSDHHPVEAELGGSGSISWGQPSRSRQGGSKGKGKTSRRQAPVGRGRSKGKKKEEKQLGFALPSLAFT